MWRRYTGSAAPDRLAPEPALASAALVCATARECSFSSGDLPMPSLRADTDLSESDH